MTTGYATIICTEEYFRWLRDEFLRKIQPRHGIISNLGILATWGAGVVVTFEYGVPPWNQP